MTSVATSMIILSRDVDHALSILNGSNRADQFVVMFTDQQSCDALKSKVSSDDVIIDWSSDNGTIGKALEYCTGDFVSVIDFDEVISEGFLDPMITIQRNIGADVVITDYAKDNNLDAVQPTEGKDVTVYHSSELFGCQKRAIETQWVKFFRRSLVKDGIGSMSELANEIRQHSSTICHYRRKLFATDHIVKIPLGKMVLGQKWSIGMGDLTHYDDLKDDGKIPITIGICAYNEQYVIEKTVKSIFSQYAGSFTIDKVIVVSSGSTDDTDKIIDRMSKENNLIHPIYQKKREGKNSAVNEIIRNSATEVIVLYNADNVFASEYTLDMLIRPLSSKDVGMTGGHPIPINSSNTIPDYTVQLMWATHHNISVEHPNMGELIAFRNVGIELPTDMQGDEAFIRYSTESKGLRTIYVPTATLFNRGPTTVKEFIKQRKRVNIGEAHISHRYGLEHSTQSGKNLSKAMWQSLKDVGFQPMKTPMAVLLEYYARAKARQYVRKNSEDMAVWEQVGSTKRL